MTDLERRFSIRVEGLPAQLVEQAPDDIELLLKPQDESPEDFFARPGLACISSGLTDPKGFTLMHIIWGDPERPGRRVSNSWLIRETAGVYTCDWNDLRKVLDSVENLPPMSR